MNPQSDMPLEYSYLLPLDTIGIAEKRLALTVAAAPRAALARRFDLVSIDCFTADLVVRRIHGSPLVQVEGAYVADIVQNCVVTDEQVPAHVEESVAVKFGPEEKLDAAVEFDPDEEDPPEPFHGNAIEVGEWLAQCLGIAIDPYPRAPDVVLDCGAAEGEDAETAVYRPFEALLSRRKDEA
ncbi:MAG: DUF177 domain-containing protein [Proteobacteria bacterium]|nr:DUF177 domain-containing protein [Pseudomonadota bacterium]